MLIFTMFNVGHLLHVGLQVDAITRSETNTIDSRWFVVHQNAFRLAARYFVSLMIFLFAWNHPGALPALLGYMGVSVSENFKGILTLPISAPLAGMIGFSIDSLLTYVPWLKNQLPPIEFKKVETVSKKTTVEETRSVQQVLAPEGSADQPAKVTEVNVKEVTNEPKEKP